MELGRGYAAGVDFAVGRTRTKEKEGSLRILELADGLEEGLIGLDSLSHGAGVARLPQRGQV